MKLYLAYISIFICMIVARMCYVMQYIPDEWENGYWYRQAWINIRMWADFRIYYSIFLVVKYDDTLGWTVFTSLFCFLFFYFLSQEFTNSTFDAKAGRKNFIILADSLFSGLNTLSLSDIQFPRTVNVFLLIRFSLLPEIVHIYSKFIL